MARDYLSRRFSIFFRGCKQPNSSTLFHILFTISWIIPAKLRIISNMGKFFFLNFNETSVVLFHTVRTACHAPPHGMTHIAYLCNDALHVMNKYAQQNGENAAVAREGCCGREYAGFERFSQQTVTQRVVPFSMTEEIFRQCERAFSAPSYRLSGDAVRAFRWCGKGSSAPENALRAIIRRSPRRQKEAESTVRQATCRLSVSISRFCFVNIFYCQYCINIHFHIILRSYEKPPSTPKNTVLRPA